MHFVDAKGILSANNGMNVYRGCTHGCIYCDGRSVCYQMDHKFEDIEVKQNAPELLERKLRSKRKRCMIGTGGMCDPYMHCEEELQISRKCLEIIDKYECGVAVHTKSDRILRDMDLLDKINQKSKAVVETTFTTFDDDLCRIIEPNVCVTSKRYQMLKKFQEKGIPTIVWMTPILPYINDTEENIKGLLNYCIDAGVKGIIIWNMGVTLRAGDREYFYAALDRNFPGMRQRYQREFGNAYEVVSPRNRELMKIFRENCNKHGIMQDIEQIFNYMQEYPEDKNYEQMSLWDMM